MDLRDHRIQLLDLRDLNGTLAEQGNADVRTRAVAIFGQAEYELASGLSIQVGGRFRHAKKTVDVGPPEPGYVPLHFLFPSSAEVKFSNFTPKVKLPTDSDSGLMSNTEQR